MGKARTAWNGIKKGFAKNFGEDMAKTAFRSQDLGPLLDKAESWGQALLSEAKSYAAEKKPVFTEGLKMEKELEKYAKLVGQVDAAADYYTGMIKDVCRSQNRMNLFKDYANGLSAVTGFVDQRRKIHGLIKEGEEKGRGEMQSRRGPSRNVTPT